MLGGKSLGVTAVGKCFQPEVSILDFHRRADVDLHAKQAVKLAVLSILVYHHAHHPAIEEVRQHIAADDEMILVPVVVLDASEQSFRRAEHADDLWQLAIHLPGNLTAQCQKRPAFLLVILAGVLILPVNVRLITAHRPRPVRDHDAAIIDAAVALG